jgi:hypothetical protein
MKDEGGKSQAFNLHPSSFNLQPSTFSSIRLRSNARCETLRSGMRKPGFGEASFGAVAGTVVAGIGGLFAIGLASAIMSHDATLLFRTPILSLISWLVSVPFGWVLGGQMGPRVGEALNSPKVELVVGGLCGLVPVGLIAIFGWYLARQG